MITEIGNSFLTVKIDTLGGQLAGIKSAEGIEYLWQGDPEFWSDRALNLFPYIGRLTNGQCRVKGKAYPMKIHGFAKDMDFSIEAKDTESVTLLLESSKETLEQYPYEFAFRIIYSLNGSTMAVKYIVENKSSEQMPFAVGGHPGFNVPLGDEDEFEDYTLHFSCPCEADRIGFTEDVYLNGRDEHYPLENGTDIKLRHDLFDEDAIILKNMASSVTLKGKAGHGVAVSYPDMPYLGFWHWPFKAAPYVCIEPWSSLPSRSGIEEELTCKSDMLRLKAGGVYENTWTVTIF